MNSLQIQALGPFRIWRNRELIDDRAWPTQKSKLLCKILITERARFVPAEWLIEQLWPERPLDRGQNNLWVAVSHLRRVLEPDLPPRSLSTYILSRPEGYRFAIDGDAEGEEDADGPVALDVDAFLAAWRAARTIQEPAARMGYLQTMRQHYAGPYMAEDLYADWASLPRRQLQEIYLESLDLLATDLTEQGQLRQAVEVCRDALLVDPTREHVYRHLMHLYTALDERRTALRVYAECVEILRRELDADPLPETVALFAAIQQGREQAGRQPFETELPIHLLASQATDERGVTERRGFSLDHAPLIGRASQLQLLCRQIDRACQGQGQVLLVEGEPGIGKSRLTQEAMDYVQRRDLSVLVTHCYEVEQDVPYQPVIDMLDQVIAAASANLFLDLSPGHLAELATLAPELAEIAPDLPTLSADYSGARQARLFRALLQCLEMVAAGRGLLVVFDDIHWADHATIQFLHFLTTRLSNLSLALLCTYRSEEAAADGDLATLVHSLARLPHSTRLVLQRFSAQETGQFLDQIAGSSDDIRRLSHWIHNETDGNPFFLVSILQSLTDRDLLRAEQPAWSVDLQGLDAAGEQLALPDALRAAVRARLQRLSPPLRRLLDIAAILGRRFDFATLCAVSAEEPLALLEMLELLIQRQFLREAPERVFHTQSAQEGAPPDGSSYDFSHDKIREVALHGISRPRRILLHRATAEALEKMTGHGVRERAAALAWHYEQGQIWGKAVAYLTQAADRSRMLFALPAAEQFYSRALHLAQAHPNQIDLAQTAALHQGRGEIRGLSGGRTADAVADLEIALAAVRELGELTKERAVLIQLGQVYRIADRLDDAIRYLSEALEAARAGKDLPSLADTLYHLGTVAWSAGDNHQAMRYHQESVEICQQLGNQDLLAVQALHGRGETYTAAGQSSAAIEHFEQSLELARRIGNRRYESENLQMICYCCLGVSGKADYERAQRTGQEAVVIARDTHLEWHEWITTTFRAHALACRGDYQQAHELTQRAVEQLDATRMLRFLSMAYDFQGYLFQDLNLHEQALGAHKAGLQAGIEANVGFWLPRLLADVAIDRMRLGDLHVEEELAEALAMALERNQQHHAVRALEGLAELFATRHEPELTIRYARQLQGVATAGNMREMEAQAYRWQAAAHLQQANYAEAQTVLRRSLLLARTIERVRLLWTVHDLAETLYLQWGRPDDADAHRRQKETRIRQITTNLREPALRAGLPVLS